MTQVNPMNEDAEFDGNSKFPPHIDNEAWEMMKPLLGEHEPAEYSEQTLPIYQGNPLIEALPPILTQEEFFELITDLPDYHNIDYNQFTPEERMHMVMTATEFFQPSSQHSHLEQHISRILRFGYRHRNPLENNFWDVVRSIKEQLQEKDEKLKKGDLNATSSKLPKKRMRKRNQNTGNKRTKMLGFTVLGISGIGKTSSFESILSTLPQVIHHNHFNGRNFTWTQIVFVKLDCPQDASLKGLCFNFFKTLDYILGGKTNYYEKYAKNGKATLNNLIIAIAHVAYIHSIGVLVIDEIQRLSAAKSGGSEQMLNFFVQLINTVGMPIILIGTPKARSFVSSEFSQIRRSISGSPSWENMQEDGEWEMCVDSLWQYQYTVTKTALTPELSHRLYYESAGIADLAVKLYILAQTRTIRLGGEEKITEELIASVAHDSLVDAKEMLRALRNRDYAALESYEDVMLIDFGVSAQQMDTVSDTPVDSEAASSDTPAQNEAVLPPTEKSRKIAAKQAKFVVPANGSLMDIIAQAQKNQVGAYDALKAAGYIKPISEFMANLAQG
jgi:hypothetical protein